MNKNKIKWGVIGAGGIADRRTLPGMMDARYAELEAVMEVDPERAEALRIKYGAKKAYTSDQALLQDPEIEAVYIASPVKFHAEQIKAAAKAGKHILCEKPISLTCHEGWKAEEACREAGVLAAAGFMMRYHSYHQKIRELLSQGRIGKLVSCRAQFTCWFPEIPGSWRQSRAEAGGGALMDLGIHCIDLIEYITKSRVRQVFSMTETKTFHYDIDDSSSTLLKLENGAAAYVDVNYNIPDEACKSRLEFYGTEGSLWAEGTLAQEEGGEVKLLSCPQFAYESSQKQRSLQAQPILVPLGNMYTKEIDSFSRSILDHMPAEVPLTEALHVQQVIEGAYTSSAQGCIQFIN